MKILTYIGIQNKKSLFYFGLTFLTFLFITWIFMTSINSSILSENIETTYFVSNSKNGDWINLGNKIFTKDNDGIIGILIYSENDWDKNSDYLKTIGYNSYTEFLKDTSYGKYTVLYLKGEKQKRSKMNFHFVPMFPIIMG